MAMNFKANLKRGFSKNELLSDLKSILAVPLYVGIPSIFKLSGWFGWTVGVSVPYILGKLLGMNEMSKGALAIGLTHLAYLYLDDPIKKINDVGIWELGTGKSMSDYGYLQNDTYGIGSINNSYMKQLPNGENIMYYPGAGVNDYIAPGTVLNDYVNTSALSDRNINQGAFQPFYANVA